MVWVKFIICILVIFYFGRKVAVYGDIIAERTGLGGLWIGVVLIAWVTSLPELFTGISAIVIVGAPDLTIGNLFGANTYNLLNLAALDIAYRNGSLLAATRPGHRLTTWFAMVLVFIPAASIFISARYSTMGIGWIGLYTPLLIVLYFVFAREIFRFEKSLPLPEAEDLTPEEEYDRMPMRNVYLYFTISAAFIIGAGIWLAMVGEEIAVVTGLGESFVGSLFIGFTTTLPEITVSFTAMSIGALDLAVANMMGSNLLNMTIFAVGDLLYLPGPMLVAASQIHLLTAFMVLVMMAIFIAGHRFRPKRFLRLSWCSLPTMALFLLGYYLNFRLSSVQRSHINQRLKNPSSMQTEGEGSAVRRG